MYSEEIAVGVADSVLLKRWLHDFFSSLPSQ